MKAVYKGARPDAVPRVPGYGKYLTRLIKVIP
jgi:hypothetical protein